MCGCVRVACVWVRACMRAGGRACVRACGGVLCVGVLAECEVCAGSKDSNRRNSGSESTEAAVIIIVSPKPNPSYNLIPLGA